MARQNARPCLLLFFMFIALATLATSDPTEGSTLEKWLIMPGPVVHSHADVEDSCDSCHDPLSDQAQFNLCVTCHADVGDDLKGNVGLHGRLPEDQRLECANCHTEHEGRDKIIVDLDEAVFDHVLTNFALSGAHTAVACDDCHTPGDKHRQAPTTCIGCHRDDDPHDRQLGPVCDSCHNPVNWSETSFDHNATAFPLTGMHDNLACNACHKSSTVTNVGRSCVACHQSDDKHEGRNGSLCADCHSTVAWSTPTFDHLAVAGFPLRGGHKGLSCQDCHNSRDFHDLDGADCVGCHRSDDVHETRNGDDCASCHVVASWRTTDFDHESRTGVALPPGHAALDCGACHTGNINDALPRSCGGCHASERVHKGQLGVQCENCHVATDWTANVWFEHDLTSFPLMGSHAELACDRCHASAAFHDADSDCVACHASDDPHRGSFGEQCEACHNPSTWQAWQFDHDKQTNFTLSGAHVGIACNDCHEVTDSGRFGTSADCHSCHRREDRHAGRLGKNCGRCHNTSTFSTTGGM